MLTGAARPPLAQSPSTGVFISNQSQELRSLVDIPQQVSPQNTNRRNEFVRQFTLVFAYDVSDFTLNCSEFCQMMGFTVHMMLIQVHFCGSRLFTPLCNTSFCVNLQVSQPFVFVISLELPCRHGLTWTRWLFIYMNTYCYVFFCIYTVISAIIFRFQGRKSVRSATYIPFCPQQHTCIRRVQVSWHQGDCQLILWYMAYLFVLCESKTVYMVISVVYVYFNISIESL